MFLCCVFVIAPCLCVAITTFCVPNNVVLRVYAYAYAYVFVIVTMCLLFQSLQQFGLTDLFMVADDYDSMKHVQELGGE